MILADFLFFFGELIVAISVVTMIIIFRPKRKSKRGE